MKGFRTKTLHAGYKPSIRMSIGLEDAEDIIYDIKQALEKS